MLYDCQVVTELCDMNVKLWLSYVIWLSSIPQLSGPSMILLGDSH